MSVRLMITNAAWAQIEPMLHTLTHPVGSLPNISDRRFIEAVLSQARTGYPWRDLPKAFGHWDAIYNRFRR